MNILEQNICCNIIVIDNFYENPMEVRKIAIQQIEEYKYNNYHPEKRSSSFATEKHKEFFNKIVEPHFGKINNFDMSKDKELNINGSFQINTSFDIKSCINVDNYSSNWGAIIYLTPNAPLTGGSGFFRYKDGIIIQSHEKILNYTDNRKDYTKWELVSSVGNIFNRLILFRLNHYHADLEYFGRNINDGRLIQLFFFNTER